MPVVYLGLGANLNDPLAQLHAALEQLHQCEQLTLLSCSSFYASKPMGPQDQPDYVNAVAAINTNLPPSALLALVQKIEMDAGRVRTRRWGERTLDIDILLYGDSCVQTQTLTIPHPGLELREFVLVPLAEVAPGLSLPNGKQVATLASNIALNGLDIIAPAVTMQD